MKDHSDGLNTVVDNGKERKRIIKHHQELDY
jgi:hypothetical protein